MLFASAYGTLLSIIMLLIGGAGEHRLNGSFPCETFAVEPTEDAHTIASNYWAKVIAVTLFALSGILLRCSTPQREFEFGAKTVGWSAFLFGLLFLSLSFCASRECPSHTTPIDGSCFVSNCAFIGHTEKLTETARRNNLFYTGLLLGILSSAGLLWTVRITCDVEF